ncbi:MAG: ribonuclease P protein component [Flavisolibacter sp.]|nr:ribonuclease P protein component [Flavisolibacter sp.]
MAVKRFGFGRKEKLKSRKKIEELFLNGKNFSVFPLRVTYQFLPAEETVVQVGVTAGKRHFKKAVDRNRIKRLIREAYRLQKTELIETLKQNHQKGFLFFMYTDKTIASFSVIKEAMSKCLQRLKKIAEVNENLS